MKSVVVAIVSALVSMPIAGQSVMRLALDKPSQIVAPEVHTSAPLLPGVAKSVAPEIETAAPVVRALPVLGISQPRPDPHPSTVAPTHTRVGVASDWSTRHLIFGGSKNPQVLSQIQNDPRWTQNWYLRHREVWWPGLRLRHKAPVKMARDWNQPLGSVIFEPMYDPGFSTQDPGGGQTYPAKYSFDVTATPDCTNDFVAIGLPAVPVAGSGGQANIIAFNNLYTLYDATGYCYSQDAATEPSVLFAYASGSGEVPGAIALSLDGAKLAYIEDILPTLGDPDGAAYFHVLTWVSGEGTDAADPVAPDAGKDLTVQLIPPTDPSVIQSSPASPFIDYTSDAAYVTTYSWASGGSGYLYKISPVFGGTPAIVWAAPIYSAVPSSPIYDTISGNVFFTDSLGNIDYVHDYGATPSAVTSTTVGAGSTSLNPPVIDSANEVVYATFNDGGGSAIVAQAYINLGTAPPELYGSNSVAVGTGTTATTGPYNVDFNNDYYTNGPAGTNSLMFVAGTDATGTVPTLYTVPFLSYGPITSTGMVSAALATGAADASPVTEFFNDPNGIPADGTDYLFVGVTNNCNTLEVASGGCVISLNITATDTNGIAGAPTDLNEDVIDAPAIAASGGSTGIIVDNDADPTTYPQASSVYYGTKTGETLVKATQALLH